MIQETIHSRLNSNPAIANQVTGILPAQPETNQTLPYLVYTVVGQQQTTFTSGQSNLAKYNVQVDAYGVDNADTASLMEQVKLSLNGWRGGNVQYSSIQSESQDKQEAHHHATHSYDVWLRLPNLQPLPDANATITTGQDFLELEACQSTLRIDCDGLTFNGDPVGGSPDLSPYARKDTANTFSANQTVTGTLAATSLSGGGSMVTNLNANNLASGTVNDARLSSNVAKLNAENVFTQSQQITGNLSLSGFVSAPTVFAGDVQTDFFTCAQGQVNDSLQVANILSCGYLCNNYFATVILDLSDMEKARVIHPLVVEANSDYTPLNVKGSPGQTTNLQEWLDSEGTPLAKVNKDGDATFPAVNTEELNSADSITIESGSASAINIQNGSGSINLSSGNLTLSAGDTLTLSASSGVVYLDGGANTAVDQTTGSIGVSVGNISCPNGKVAAGYVEIQSNTVGAPDNALVISCGVGEAIYFGDNLNTGVIPDSNQMFVAGSVSAGNGFFPGSLNDIDAANGTIYFSTDASKLVYKDAGGTVHALY